MRVKEQRIERVEIKKIYVANDGTQFDDENECRKYEATARCAIEGMFRTLNLQKTEYMGEHEPFNFFYCEDNLYAVKIENVNQLEIVNKWIRERDCTSRVLGEEAIGTIQMINEYDGGVWIIGTPDDLKKRYIDGIDVLFDKLINTAEEVKGEESC